MAVHQPKTKLLCKPCYYLYFLFLTRSKHHRQCGGVICAQQHLASETNYFDLLNSSKRELENHLEKHLFYNTSFENG